MTANMQGTEKRVPESQSTPYYRPDETRRLELARQWLEQARGKAPEPKR